MIRKTIVPIALALVLGALPASADHRSGDRERSHRHEREAFAGQRAKIEKQERKIERLSLRLDDATSELFGEAVTRSRHRGWREWRAIHALRRLERTADRFARKVSHHGATSRNAEVAYLDLESAHRDAVARCDDLRNPRRLRDEFRRVGRLMDKLDGRFARLAELERQRRHASYREPESRHRRHRSGRDADFWLSSRDGRPAVAFRFGF
jgi:hypothetical protein